MSSDTGSMETITIVSGLPRSGTSLMMQMLEAAGLEVLTDGVRRADEDNPRGYYELEKVKDLGEDNSWIPAARGKVVKVVSAHLYSLPEAESYRIIFMTRPMGEILRSQAAMLKRRDADPGPDDREMAKHYETHLAKVRRWLHDKPHFEVMDVGYHDILADAHGVAERVCGFLARDMDIRGMAAVVEPALCRIRAEGHEE